MLLHTMLLVAKLHLDQHKLKSNPSSLSVTSFCSLHVLPRLQGPTGPSSLSSMQKSMKDFHPHALINMHLLYGWECQLYWVKCWVLSEFSNKTRKNKLHKQINETWEARWAASSSRLSSLIAYSVPQWPVDTGTLAYLFHPRTHTHAPPSTCTCWCLQIGVCVLQACIIKDLKIFLWSSYHMLVRRQSEAVYPGRG